MKSTIGNKARMTPISGCVRAIYATLLIASHSFGQEAAPTVSIDLDPRGFRITPEHPGSYFLIRGASVVDSPFGNIGMTLSDESLLYVPGQSESMGFFDAEAISVFAPRDTDRDGIDDLYELGKGLNPLDAADAALPSSIAGLSNLGEYKLRFRLGSAPPQYYSREVSAFNFGSSRTEAISREQSVFNFGGAFSLEAHAREVSVFNGEHVPVAGFPQIYSRELSIFNFGGAKAFEAHAREVSVFNGERHPTSGYAQVYSRETSVFNFGAPRATVETISREVSVFNNISQ